MVCKNVVKDNFEQIQYQSYSELQELFFEVNSMFVDSVVFVGDKVDSVCVWIGVLLEKVNDVFGKGGSVVVECSCYVVDVMESYIGVNFWQIVVIIIVVGLFVGFLFGCCF